MTRASKRILLGLGAAVLAGVSAFFMLGWAFNDAEILKMKAHGTYACLFGGVALLAFALGWWFSGPSTVEELPEAKETHAIAQEILAEAMRTVDKQVGVPPQVAQRFRTRYWIRLTRLFKL